MKYFLFSFILFQSVIFTLNSFGVPDGSFYYQNAVYKDEIKSVQLFPDGAPLSMPVIGLGTSQQLVLKFDNVSGATPSYSYTLIHCDADWNESFLSQPEYLDGFPDNPIDDYALSFNTTANYVNYQLRLPNERVKMNCSGNYVLVVFEDGDRDKLVITQRFYVIQPKVEVRTLVKRATFDPFNGDNQEVDFTVYHPQITLNDPFMEMKVVLMQNRRWDNAVRNLKPLFVRQAELDYNYDRENVFPGGNEFRYFDIRSWKYNGENVANTGFFDPYYHVTLLTDELRSNKKYFDYREMNGAFSIESQDRIEDADTECDYGFVHFTLAMPVPLLGGSVNVFGELTGWNANQSNEMLWNAERNEYELTLFLKQGYYNYEYVYVPKGGAVADAGVIEGNHYDTENEYHIFVYYKSLSGRYDELVGFQQVSSQN
ncbi:MAG: DUF5103 domain-containing protein [Mangrovibacterium sp.]